MLYCWLYCFRLNFPLRRMWLAVMVLNSSYSFYWDVEQDWDMPWLVQYGECLGAVPTFTCLRRPFPPVPVRVNPY